MLKGFIPKWDNDTVKFNHHPNIPESFRMLLVGSSGCG